MNDTQAISILAEHVAGTLPDSLSQRLTVLTAMRQVMTKAHPAYRLIGEQIDALNGVRAMQADLPLHFQPTNNHSQKH